MQRKATLLILMLLTASIALSGCALVVKDPVKDAAQIILDVNGETVNKAEFAEKVKAEQDYLRGYYAYYAQFYQMYYGISSGVPSENELHDEAVENVHKNLVNQYVISQKAKEMGLDTLTAEEEEAALAEGKTNYDSVIQQVIDTYLTDSENEGDALTEEAQKYAEENLDIRLADYEATAKENAVVSKVRAEVVKDVTVTDEEVQNEYTVHVDEAKAEYAENPGADGTAVNNGTPVYYAPAGYRYVKQILLGFAEEDQTAVTEANSALTTAQSALTAAQNAVTANEEKLAAEDLSEEDRKALTEEGETLKQTLADAQADYDAKSAAAKEALDKAFENLQPKLDEVQQKLAAGEDFDALIEQYNTDPGMQREPGKTNGYAVMEGFADFMPDFVTAAMGLQNIGDVSEPVRNDTYGYFIIKYTADIPEGETGLEAFQDTIRSQLLSSKQDETYNTTLESWINSGKIGYWPERLAD